MLQNNINDLGIVFPLCPYTNNPVGKSGATFVNAVTKVLFFSQAHLF